MLSNSLQMDDDSDLRELLLEADESTKESISTSPNSPEVKGVSTCVEYEFAIEGMTCVACS